MKDRTRLISIQEARLAWLRLVPNLHNASREIVSANPFWLVTEQADDLFYVILDAGHIAVIAFNRRTNACVVEQRWNSEYDFIAAFPDFKRTLELAEGA
jgi:hypothetical protein